MSTSNFYYGYEGSVRFNATGGTAVQATSVKSWSMTVRKEILDTTKAGDTARGTAGGLVSGSGSIELIYDGSNNDLIEAVNKNGDTGNALFELYLSSQTSKRITFNGIIEEASYGSASDEVQIISCSFVTNGTIALDL